MGKFSGCLLAADVDGTLLTSGIFPMRNITAIEYFVKEGGNFALSTGRTVGAVGMVTSKLKDIGPSITGNGSVIYDFKNREIKHCVYLSEGAKLAVCDFKRAFPDIGIEVHSGTDVFVLTRSSETDDHEAYEDLTALPITPEETLKLDCNKVLIALEGENQNVEIGGFFDKYSECADFLTTSAMVDGRMRFYYEVVPNGCNKAKALLKLKEILEIKEGRCFAIGDYYNDLEMIKAADVSAVTKEAPKELKDAATTVVGGVLDGAVADFIEYIDKLIGQEENL